MADYHVGCGAFGIYAGTLNSKNKTLWQNKSDVTDEAVSAVAQYLLQEKKFLLFTRDGVRYRMAVTPVQPKEEKPRVLTLEEARRAEYCVMEVRNGKELMQFVHDERGGYFSPNLNGREHPYFEDIAGDDEYNVHVRCWSAIPTDEQRKEVRWNATD